MRPAQTKITSMVLSTNCSRANRRGTSRSCKGKYQEHQRGVLADRLRIGIFGSLIMALDPHHSDLINKGTEKDQAGESKHQALASQHLLREKPHVVGLHRGAMALGVGHSAAARVMLGCRPNLGQCRKTQTTLDRAHCL